jgi:hypothetical protein
MKTQKHIVREYIIDRLNDGIGSNNYACDLHHYLFNEDYFIIGTYNAKQWLGDDSWEAIEKIQEYEQTNFGEVNTALSDPERVANMLAYILGEEILWESETLQSKWNDEILKEEDLKVIAKELESELEELENEKD